MFAYAQHKHRSAERFGGGGGMKGENGRHGRAFYVRRRRDTQLRRRKRHARESRTVVEFSIVHTSKPLTKSGLESPFLMLPGTSYDDVCVRVRRVHKRPRRDGQEKRFKRDRLLSSGFCVRITEITLRTDKISISSDVNCNNYHTYSQRTLYILKLIREIMYVYT